MFSSFVSAGQVIDQQKTKVFCLGVTLGFRVQIEFPDIALGSYTKQPQTHAGRGVAHRSAGDRWRLTLKLS